MLRNRSRTVTKQPIMAEQSALPSPNHNQTRPISSFFGSPRFFHGILAKPETLMSPTSILDSKHLSNFGNPFGFDKNLPKTPKIFSETKHPNEKLDSEGIGLALVEEKTSDNICKPKTRKVLFGSKLKIQIPPVISPTESPNSPGDFGIKTRNSQLPGTPTSAFGCGNSCIQTEGKDSTLVSTGPLSLSEMELSEEYTCVISRGPNPKTTHIYDNCVVETCCGVVGLPELKRVYHLKSASQNFLCFCHTCKKNLEDGKDIYIYRGEKAFCSEECRSQEMLLDGVKNS